MDIRVEITSEVLDMMNIRELALFYYALTANVKVADDKAIGDYAVSRFGKEKWGAVLVTASDFYFDLRRFERVEWE